MKKIIIHIILFETYKFFGIEFDGNACYPKFLEKEMTDMEIIQLLSCTHFEGHKIIESSLSQNQYQIKLQPIRISKKSIQKELASFNEDGWK